MEKKHDSSVAVVFSTHDNECSAGAYVVHYYTSNLAPYLFVNGHTFNFSHYLHFKIAYVQWSRRHRRSM